MESAKPSVFVQSNPEGIEQVTTGKTHWHLLSLKKKSYKKARVFVSGKSFQSSLTFADWVEPLIVYNSPSLTRNYQISLKRLQEKNTPAYFHESLKRPISEAHFALN